MTYISPVKTALINDFVSLIYPRTCEACERILFRHESMVCSKCLVTLPKSHFHHNPNNPLLKIMGGRVPLVNASSLYLFEKGGRVQRMLHAIKYEGQSRLAYILGCIAGKELKSDPLFSEAQVLLPIPLHANKLKSRGYNQSEAFATGIAKTMNLPIDTTSLIRAVETSTQTKKRKYERWENVAGIFELTDIKALSGKHVVLVDDVVTTGATIEAAWLCLQNVEGIKVSLASLAFAEK